MITREPEDRPTTAPPRPSLAPRSVSIGPVHFGSIEELRRRLGRGGPVPWIGERRRRRRAWSGDDSS